MELSNDTQPARPNRENEHIVELPLTKNIRPGALPPTLEEYEKGGGYAALRQATSSMTPLEVQELITTSGLRGRGGAGFLTGKKWSFTPMGPSAPSPKYLIVNADEMEPGSFKDRLLLEGDPHVVIEGALIAAYAIEARFVYIFLRREYAKAATFLTKAVEEARRKGYVGGRLGPSDWEALVDVHVSCGRYMCGEETGLINALEGKRATPRAKPPFPQRSGLFGKPTIVNNTETIASIPSIILNGASWYASLGKGQDGGTKLFGVSGKVNRPGLWELPMGTTAREIIEGHAGGMRSGLSLKGFLPGGASTDFLTSERLDVPMNFTSVQKAGSRLGTATIIVLDNKTCPVGMVYNLERFFARESCGWCTPCREGLPWIRSILEAIESGSGKPGDIDQLERLCGTLSPGRTFCALAPGAVEPLQSALKYFREDFQRHIHEKKCPYT